MKIKWKVAEAATGPYRSFHGRSWPHGEIKVNGQDKWAVRIECWLDGKAVSSLDPGARITTAYTPARSRKENLAEENLSLKVYIIDFSQSKNPWRGLTKLNNSLVEAKAAAVRAYEQHPEFLPKEEQS